jgi:hypothetical protein
MAESMTYNRQSLGMVGRVLAGYGAAPDQRRYIQFFRDNFEHFRDVDNIADVAVLQSHASMGFNNDRPWQSAMLFEQVLIQANIPFDIVFDDNLIDLSKYHVLVLADQECLSDAQVELIRRFVKQGGGLVATEHSSLYTEWRQRRRDFGLRDLLRVEAPPWHDGSEPDELLKTKPVRNSAGGGRVVYLAEVKPAIEKPPGASMTSEYWKLPVNWEELVSAVKWAAGDKLSLEVSAPLTLVAELIQQKGRRELLLHLLNYQGASVPRVRDVQATLQIPAGGKVTGLTLLSPDGNRGTVSPHYTVQGQRMSFTVPEIEIYSVAVIKLE